MGNSAVIGQGLWAVISGIGGSFVDPANPTTVFHGLPTMSYNLEWTISNSCGSSSDIVIISFADTNKVKKVLSDVAIDGILEESFWNISNQISLNLGSSDNTASFGVLWDDDYLYVGVNVVDGTLCTNGRMGWWDDGVEICIDGDHSQGTTFDQYDRRFVKPVNSYWIQEEDGQLQQGVMHQWMETNDGYSMEFAIPWNNFNISPAVGISIGFNVAINDDDYCSSYNSLSQLLWFGNSTYYKNSSVWGTLTLGDQTVSYSGDYIALINPNGGDFCINNKTTVINWVSNGVTNVDIDYSTDNGSSWNSIAANLPAASGSYTWNVSATPSDQCLLKISDANNQSVNDISENIFTISAPLTAVKPLISNIWDNYQWPYNAYYPVDPNGINGHVGNACGPSALTRILHSWEFPIVGNDLLTFTDNGGFTWSANFGATTYNYDNMPNYLPPGSSQAEYTDVATLFYHAATSMYDVNGSGGNLNKMSYAMSHYFNYKVSVETLRENFTRAEWIQTMRNELDNGRVLLVGGMTLVTPGTWHETNNVAGHWYNIDGYNEDGEFHVVVGFGNFDGYYDADSLSGYAFNIGILTNLEPDLNGKALSLISPDGGEGFLKDADTVIAWTSNNVSDIKIEYTIDNGANWQNVIASTSASTGIYTWTVPDTVSDQCKIKLTDVIDINVYDKSDDVFSISPSELNLISPNGGEYYFPASLISISWANTVTSDIKIEYTVNNGSYWNEITNSISASTGFYDWAIPDSISDQCKIRITDIANASNYDESDNTFEIAVETSNALQFDGTDDYVITPLVIDQSSGSPGVTMEAWVYPTSTAGWRRQVICTDNGGYDWSILREGSVWCVFNNSTSVNTGFSVDINTWQHLAVVFIPGTGIRFYKDGVEMIIPSVSTTTSNGVIAIGNNPGFPGEEFTGKIDEVRVWNYPRSQSEILAKMNQYLTGLESGLGGYWRMNIGLGQTVFDLTGNGNEGQLGSTPGADVNDPAWVATNWPYGSVKAILPQYFFQIAKPKKLIIK